MANGMDAVTTNFRFRANTGNPSGTLTNPSKNIVRILLRIRGEITKPLSTDTATFRGDGSLNAIQSASLLVDNVVLQQWAPRDYFWYAAFTQMQSSRWTEADINDVISGATTFPFSWYIEINLDLPGQFASGLAGVYGAQSVQLDLRFGTIADILVGPPAGWTLQNVSADVFAVETSMRPNGPLMRVSNLSSFFGITQSGRHQSQNANGRRDIISLAYFIRDDATGERQNIADTFEILEYNNNSLVRADVETALDLMLARMGSRLVMPTAEGIPAGFFMYDFTWNGVRGAIRVENSLVLNTILNIVATPPVNSLLTVLTTSIQR
ncbi:MAG: hypothetical protein NUW37_06900 [Planctomycetes bacterium]|nr:hypothetical protein [Planctomycetota bacterium]